MSLFFVLVLVVLVVFLMLSRYKSGFSQSGRQSQKKSSQDANSDSSLLLIHQQNDRLVNHVTASAVDNDSSGGFVDHSSHTYSTGGELGTALADAVDAGGDSFGSFDGGSSDFSGGGSINGTGS